MRQEWYYLQKEVVRGPVISRRLKRLADLGEIETATQVRLGKDGRWRPAGTVGRLFTAGGVPGNGYAARPPLQPVRPRPKRSRLFAIGVCLLLPALSLAIWQTRDEATPATPSLPQVAASPVAASPELPRPRTQLLEDLAWTKRVDPLRPLLAGYKTPLWGKLELAEPTVEPLRLLDAQEQFEDLVRQTLRSVVRVHTNRGRGTGFLIAGDLVVTNHHVVSEAISVSITFPEGKSCTSPGWVAVSTSHDLAILAVPDLAERLPTLEFTDRPPNLDTPVCLVRLSMGSWEPVNAGFVCNVRPRHGTLKVITDAAAAPGDSGSPLIDRDGRVVAVTDAVMLNKNLSTAIAARYVVELSKKVTDQPRPWSELPVWRKGMAKLVHTPYAVRVPHPPACPHLKKGGLSADFHARRQRFAMLMAADWERLYGARSDSQPDTPGR